MLQIKVDTKSLQRQLLAFEREIPFAQASAVNDLAFQVQRAENEAMKTVFHHPRSFTQKATAVKKGTKALPTATVFIKAAQERYLRPYEEGGQHVTPGRALLEPVNVKLDAYGQMPKGTVQRLAADPNVFVGTVRGVAGFWKRIKGHHLRLMIRFGKNKPVSAHLDFKKRAVALVAASGPAAVKAAVTKAIATARL